MILSVTRRVDCRLMYCALECQTKEKNFPLQGRFDWIKELLYTIQVYSTRTEKRLLSGATLILIIEGDSLRSLCKEDSTQRKTVPYMEYLTTDLAPVKE